MFSLLQERTSNQNFLFGILKFNNQKGCVERMAYFSFIIYRHTYGVQGHGFE
jgi:hypothetical protein